jgi:acetyl-CoA/propionyl-CoA carboxylase biotin carboxyl carrier protein
VLIKASAGGGGKGMRIVERESDLAEAIAGAAREGARVGYPLMVKAVAGGGGKGMRIVESPAELLNAVRTARSEAGSAFGDTAVYFERRIASPRHIEIQLLGDHHGTVIPFVERECSIQRRHQKLIEESPAPEWIVDEELRERIGKIAVDAARAVDYRGAGTVEGLLAADTGEYFFLEMNTRVQVEHCVTEMTTGIDIVKEGIRAAAGEPLSVAQDDVVLRGHAIECRINAEDAAQRFMPTPGTITGYDEPAGPGVRVDSGARAGSVVSDMYDPMIAKLIVWDADREQATARMLRALGEFRIEGLTTLIGFHRALLATEQWARGETCRDLIEDAGWLGKLAQPPPEGGEDDEDDAVEQTYTVEVSGRRFDVRVIGPPPSSAANGAAGAGTSGARKPQRAARKESKRKKHGSDTLASPMQGNVWKVPVKEGQEVAEGDIVTIIEAMKMENEITAHKSGVIAELPISEGDAVRSGDVLAVIKDPA